MLSPPKPNLRPKAWIINFSGERKEDELGGFRREKCKTFRGKLHFEPFKLHWVNTKVHCWCWWFIVFRENLYASRGIILDLLKMLRKSKRYGMGPPYTIPKPELLGHFQVIQLQSPPFGKFPPSGLVAKICPNGNSCFSKYSQLTGGFNQTAKY